jgi:hypothetical protein
MNPKVRELFESTCVPNFVGNSHGVRRKENGEYTSDSLEDHWQTFQEAFELAVMECAKICTADAIKHTQNDRMIAAGVARNCGHMILKEFDYE